jgi:hypothetical protein
MQAIKYIPEGQGMPRPKRLDLKLLIWFEKATVERIRALVGERAVGTFIREAAERELKRQERAVAKAGKEVGTPPA